MSCSTMWHSPGATALPSSRARSSFPGKWKRSCTKANWPRKCTHDTSSVRWSSASARWTCRPHTAAAIPASTVYAYPEGFQTYSEALPALAIVIVPALLMVSTIRFRSFKTFDLQTRRSYPVLILLAVGLALLVAHPEIVLVAMAYAYLASGLIGLAWQRMRRKPAGSVTQTPGDEAPAPGSEQPALDQGAPERRAE